VAADNIRIMPVGIGLYDWPEAPLAYLTLQYFQVMLQIREIYLDA